MQRSLSAARCSDFVANLAGEDPHLRFRRRLQGEEDDEVLREVTAEGLLEGQQEVRAGLADGPGVRRAPAQAREGRGRGLEVALLTRGQGVDGLWKKEGEKGESRHSCFGEMWLNAGSSRAFRSLTAKTLKASMAMATMAGEGGERLTTLFFLCILL